MNAESDPMKSQEYELLTAIAQDSLVTQGGLSTRLGIAVGSVNWYLKRLVGRGYVKVSHLDRTRLKYHLTPKGMSVLTQRTLQYMKSSLQVYNQFREKAKVLAAELKAQGITQAYLEGDDEMMDILRLTCIEADIACRAIPDGVILKAEGPDYRAVFPTEDSPETGQERK